MRERIILSMSGIGKGGRWLEGGYDMVNQMTLMSKPKCVNRGLSSLPKRLEFY